MKSAMALLALLPCLCLSFFMTGNRVALRKVTKEGFSLPVHGRSAAAAAGAGCYRGGQGCTGLFSEPSKGVGRTERTERTERSGSSSGSGSGSSSGSNERRRSSNNGNNNGNNGSRPYSNNNGSNRGPGARSGPGGQGNVLVLGNAMRVRRVKVVREREAKGHHRWKGRKGRR